MPFSSLAACSWSLQNINTRILHLNNFYAFCEITAENIIYYVTLWQNLQNRFFVEYSASKTSVSTNKWADFLSTDKILCNSMLSRERKSSLMVLAARKLIPNVMNNRLAPPVGVWWWQVFSQSVRSDSLRSHGLHNTHFLHSLGVWQTYIH